MKYSLPRLKHTLRAKAVLCPGLEVVFHDLSSKDKETISWQYEGGLTDYLLEALDGIETLPEVPFEGSLQGNQEAVGEFSNSFG